MVDFNPNKLVIKSKSDIIFYSVLDIRCHFLICFMDIENKMKSQNAMV